MGLLRGRCRRGPRHRLPDTALPFAEKARGPRRSIPRSSSCRVRRRGPRRGAHPPAPRVGKPPPCARPSGGRAAGRDRPRQRPAGGAPPPRQGPPRPRAARRGGAGPPRRRDELGRRSAALPRPSLPRAPGRAARASRRGGRLLPAGARGVARQPGRAPRTRSRRREDLGPRSRAAAGRGDPAASRRLDRAADPWWLYLFGPPGVAKAARDRVWTRHSTGERAPRLRRARRPAAQLPPVFRAEIASSGSR